MYKVSIVDKKTKLIYEGSEKTFDSFDDASTDALTRFALNFGYDVNATFEFIDSYTSPLEISSVELFPKFGDDGVFLFKDTEVIH
jgi:hypothetical protein